jgi:hypothetical protein
METSAQQYGAVSIVASANLGGSLMVVNFATNHRNPSLILFILQEENKKLGCRLLEAVSKRKASKKMSLR